MRHFTPELLDRCRSRDDATAEAAAAEWDAASEAYAATLESLRTRVGRATWDAIEGLALHDAEFLAVYGSESLDECRAALIVRLAGRGHEPGPIREVRYAGVEPGREVSVSQKKSGLATAEPGRPRILYDEFDMDVAGTLTHSLLLTDGGELVIRFSELRVARAVMAAFAGVEVGSAPA